jgi:hypothetical protein
MTGIKHFTAYSVTEGRKKDNTYKCHLFNLSETKNGLPHTKNLVVMLIRNTAEIVNEPRIKMQKTTTSS